MNHIKSFLLIKQAYLKHNISYFFLNVQQKLNNIRNQ